MRSSSSRSSQPQKVGANTRTSAHQGHWEQGVKAGRSGEWALALRCFEKALQAQPLNPLYLLNAASASYQLGQMERALAFSDKGWERSTDVAASAWIKASALNKLFRHAESLSFLQSLPEAIRGCKDYWKLSGAAAHGCRQYEVAAQAYLNALSYGVDDAVMHYNLGNAFYQGGLKEEAAECLRTALILGLGPDTLHAQGVLAFAERENCRWFQAEEVLTQMKAQLALHSEQDAIKTAPFAHLSLIDDPQHQRKISTLLANTWADRQPLSLKSATPGKRIRLGYLSGDFYDHATCVLMAEVFESHDRDRFEVYAYSHSIDDGSALRARVVQAFEHFVEVSHLTDAQIAQRIADDAIDVLIDLKGYTAEHRVGVLAYRPAPVQATFLGFPGTTGSKFIDYVIGDPVVTPMGHAGDFSEAIAQLPICYQPNDRQRPRPVGTLKRSDVGLPEDAVVLCGFNQAYKISPEVLDVWCALLRELPQAVLWLLDWHGQAKPNLSKELAARGVSLDRVFWAPKARLAEHISRIRLADVFLDTWPYNAHTTCSDVLWAGVPVVTFEGRTFACRVASSLMRACGLREWVAVSREDYAAKVVHLAGDGALRASIRQHLDAQRDLSPLFDSARFTRDFEALIDRMVIRQRESMAPEPLLAVESLESQETKPKAPSKVLPTMRVAVVTPYHAESREWLERCIQSVQVQTHPVTHFLVADGVAQDWIDDLPNIRHIKLGAAHKDYGNTPRAIGGLLAVSEGFEAISFLDADNWYAPEHVAQCVETASASDADYVVSRRRLMRDDGSILPIEYAEDLDGSHVDTNCYFLRPGAFHTIARWALAPKPMASLFDRFYLEALRKEGLSVALTHQYTVMYLCTWAAVYRDLSESPPAFAKDNVSTVPLTSWRSQLTPQDIEHVMKLAGVQL